MATPIYEYEVELRLTNPNTKERRTVVRREHAYTLMDAYMQAHLITAAEAGSAEIALVRIGPPADAVLSAAQVTRDTVNAAVAAILDSAQGYVPSGKAKPPTGRKTP